MVRSRCPNDGSAIPQVGGHSDAQRPLVRFFWCAYCKELFAFVGEDEPSGRFAVSFRRDQESGVWRVCRAVGSERDVGLAAEAVVRVESPT